MALATKQFSGKKQKILMAALGGVVLIILAVVYFGFWRRPAPVLSPSSPAPVSTSTASTSTAPANGGKAAAPAAAVPTSQSGQSGVDGFAELRQSPAFQGLRQFGRWPLPIEPKGRSDPFLVPPPTTEEELKANQP